MFIRAMTEIGTDISLDSTIFPPVALLATSKTFAGVELRDAKADRFMRAAKKVLYSAAWRADIASA